MSRSTKPHKILAQAQKTMAKFGWTKGTWHNVSGVCLEGAVGIRGRIDKTRTKPRLQACDYIAIAAVDVIGPRIARDGDSLQKDRMNEVTAAVRAKLDGDPHGNMLVEGMTPTINDTLLKDEEEAMAILAHAEKLAYTDYIDNELFKAR